MNDLQALPATGVISKTAEAYFKVDGTNLQIAHDQYIMSTKDRQS